MTTSGVAVEDEDGFTELRDASVPRVDGVSAAANGTPWFFAKQAEDQRGLFDADFVRELIEKTDAAAAAVEPQETVTMTGSPSAIAAMIHAAAVRKAEPAPVEGESPGMTSKIPDNWAADGSLEKADVEKAMETDDGIDGMDPTVILAEPDDEAPGDPTDPGSPAWESIDAATARKWTAIAARLRAALMTLVDREVLESVSANGDEDDAYNAEDLSDAASAIDYTISVLAPFAVDEQAEADCAADMEMVGKAIAGLDPATLETVEALGPVRKAGRTLSSANEAALRAALQSLQQVLASLPKAPAAPVGDTTEMTKEESPEMSDNDTAVQDALDASTPLGTPKEPAAAETPAAAGMPGEVAKAGKPPQVAIYDANGNLVGTVDPAEITMLAPAKAPEAAADASVDDGTDGGNAATDDTQMAAADTADAATPTDLAPAPAATVGTPADAVQADDDGNVAKADTPTNDVPTEDMLKSSIQDMVKAAIDDYSAGQADVVKGLEDRNRALEERNEALIKRLDVLENAPAVMAIASNGAVPPAHMLRGQDRGASTDMTRGELLKARLNNSDDAVEKKRIADEMQELAIARFSEMQRR
jgi:hypothetical protein